MRLTVGTSETKKLFRVLTCTVSLPAALTTNAVSAVALVLRPWSSTMGIILP